MDTQPTQTVNEITPTPVTEALFAKEPIATKTVELTNSIESDQSQPYEKRIMAYLENRKIKEFTKINDFLKFLYPQPKYPEPAQWLKQDANKSLKVLLDRMQQEGKIVINNNQHRKLATFFYAGNNPQTQYYNIGNLLIEAKLP